MPISAIGETAKEKMNSKKFKNKSGIYEIWIKDYVYIGSSKNIYSRIEHHKYLLRANKHINTSLQDIYNLLGESSVEVKLYIETSKLKEEEEFRTIALRRDFKVLNIDNGTSRSRITKEKISTSMKGNYNGGELKWTEKSLREAAGNKLYSKTEFTKKYSAYAVSLAKKLNIDKEIFKIVPRGKRGRYKAKLNN